MFTIDHTHRSPLPFVPSLSRFLTLCNIECDRCSHMTKKSVGLLLFILVGYQANASDASGLAIDSVAQQSLGLGTSKSVTITVKGEGAADLTVDASALTQDSDHDLSFLITPKHVTFTDGSAQAVVMITTKTSAPSFTGGKFSVVARSGEASATVDVGLDVKAEYLVKVIQKRDGHCAENSKVTDGASWICDFDSPTETSYFRAHAGGLKVFFENDTQDTLTIHGSDAIKHGMQAVPPGKQDTLSRTIDPTSADLKGAYTLHEIYRPGRDVVFNASRIPR